MKKKGIVFLSFVLVLEAQNIDISKFYYRDYLDFGQGYGAFNGENSGKANTSNGTTLTGKDGTKVSVPNVPNFSASSNYGSLTSVGRGFAVTANHVVSFTPEYDSTGVYRKFGLTSYKVSGDTEGDDISKPYGRDEKFTRFDKYIVEGRVDMLDFANSIDTRDTTQENANIQNFKTQLNDFAKDNEGNVYIYQTGSGIITLRNSYSGSTSIKSDTNGETRGGGFGTLKQDSITYEKLVYCPSESCSNTNVYGMYFHYIPNSNFNNRITTGDSGSGIYAYNTTKKEWVLLGVTSQSQNGQNRAYISAVSNKDLQNYQSKFEQKVDLKITEPNINEWTLTTNSLKYDKRGDTPDKSYTLGKNKDIIFSGNGTMTIRVQENIQLNQDRVGAGGFVFEAGNSASGANSYKLTQESTDKMGFYFGKGGGKLDLAGNSLVLNTIAANDSKAIITNSSTSTQSTLEIQGLGYDTNGKKMTNKADTIIHASIGDNTNGANGANLNLFYKGEKTPTNRHSEGENATEESKSNRLDSSLSAKAQNDSTASLIFDGHINIQGELKAKDGNIVLQGHPTTHATISDKTIREQIQNAESGTSQKMPDYMDLSKPSTLKQPDWDSRNFSIKQGITLTNATLMVGKAANVTADINADNTSQIYFGGRHFIDSKDGKNVIGSGFSYQQGVTSGDLTNETYKDSSFVGKIIADGATITSKFMNFAPNLELSNKASLKATNLTLNSTNTLNFKNGSTAQIDNLIVKELSNLDGKITLNDSSKFEVKESFTFDNSTFDLNTLKTANNLTLPTAYNLYAFNNSKITTNDFQNTNANAEFMLDKSTFTAANGVSFQSTNLNLNLSNSSTMSINSFKSTGETSLIIKQGSTLKTTGDIDLKKATIQLTSENSSLNAKNLTLNEKSSIILDDKATLTLTNTFTSENLTLTLGNESKFNAKTLTASGIVNLKGDKNATLDLTTLNLSQVSTANLGGVTSTIGTLNLTQTSQANIGENVSITTLKLTESTANLQNLNTKLPQSIDLQSNSNLHFNELNLNEFNTKSLNLTSDETSQAHIKKLIYDATNAQANGTKTAPQSNLVVSEKFELKNVGQNLSTTTGAQNTLDAQGTPSTDDEKLQKDLFALKFDKNLELGSGAKLDISFADKVTKENLLFDKDYKIFSASTLTGSNLNINFTNSNGASFGGTNFFAKGRLDKDENAFFVQFVRENPRNFSKLNPHINPAYSPFLEILLQHNKFDKSIDKAVNLGDYSALQERLVNLDESFKHLANSSSNVLETLPLLQRHNINARIQSRRFASAKYAYNEERYNPLQKSDFMPTLLYLDQMEQEERVWSNAGGGYFTKDESKMSLQSVSVGYDKKLLGNEFLFGAMASITQTQLSHSADDFKQNPQIYSLAFYSNALLDGNELQNELGFSFFNDKRHIGDEELSAGGFGSFFNSLYKLKLTFLPQNFKPIILANANFNSLNAIDTPTYIQKSYKDLSFDVGLGFELDFEKKKGFYNVSFIAKQDVYHSEDEVLVSLARADKFISYKSNEPSLSYQLHLMGLENFNNGMFLRYSLSGFIDTKAYKGVSANIQLGYKY